MEALSCVMSVSSEVMDDWRDAIVLSYPAISSAPLLAFHCTYMKQVKK